MAIFFVSTIVTKTILKSNIDLIEISDALDLESEKEEEKELEEFKTTYDQNGLKSLCSNFNLPQKNFSIEAFLSLHHPEITSPPPKNS